MRSWIWVVAEPVSSAQIWNHPEGGANRIGCLCPGCKRTAGSVGAAGSERDGKQPTSLTEEGRLWAEQPRGRSRVF